MLENHACAYENERYSTQTMFPEVETPIPNHCKSGRHTSGLRYPHSRRKITFLLSPTAEVDPALLGGGIGTPLRVMCYKGGLFPAFSEYTWRSLQKKKLSVSPGVSPTAPAPPGQNAANIRPTDQRKTSTG